MNEHQLQMMLTTRWVEHGLTLHGERLFLAAWEVMDNYRINDAHHGFGRPAIDFLFLDPRGRMVALELKPSVLSPRQSWAVLCQVTHRAYLLADGYTAGRLESAHLACHSGRHGRVPPLEHVPALSESHARVSGIEPIATLPGLPIGRTVAACAFGRSWEPILSAFTTGPREHVVSELARYSPKGGPGHESTRWAQLPA